VEEAKGRSRLEEFETPLAGGDRRGIRGFVCMSTHLPEDEMVATIPEFENVTF
jgi:hypothetical protein